MFTVSTLVPTTGVFEMRRVKFVSAARVRAAYVRLERLIRDPRVPELALITQFERATELELIRREWEERKRRLPK